MQFSESNLPTTWEELIALKENLSSTNSDAIRFEDICFFYKEYRRIVPKKLRHQIILNSIGNNDFKITRNTFPYDRLTKNIPHIIHHYCLWSKIGKLDESTILAEIKKTFPQKDFFWWENSTKTKSIPEIWHCQIFIKEN